MPRVSVLPRRARRERLHSTMQPVFITPTSPPRYSVRVRIPGGGTPCREYLDGATLLRDLGMHLAADLLTAAGEAIRTPVPTTTVDDDTVVHDPDPMDRSEG